jgi:Domain of Unknown Function (DUF326)
MPHQQYKTSMDAAIHCAYECEYCSDACLGDMVDCARLCRDCAQMCWTIAGFMSRGSQFVPPVVRACIDICEACAAECEKHDHEHCQNCAKACRAAIEEYRKMVSVATSHA